MADIEKILSGLSVEELCGQLLCFNVPPEWTDEEFEAVVKTTKPGGVFVSGKSADKDKISLYRTWVEKYTGIPALIAGDVEQGPGFLQGEANTHHAMALGAADDPVLTERLQRSCAQICRKNGINWTFSPVVDINKNPDNPVTNIRAISDSPAQVSRIAAAQIRGFQRDGLLMAACKHFPGDGMDDRNQHFCTTVNPLSAAEWMASFGKVYRDMFEAGVAAVMVGHISLPAFQGPEEYDEIFGYLPATLSHSLQTKLLKERLGFDGCIVSDAMSMVGACAAVPTDRLAVAFIKAGGDMLLYPLPEDYDRILRAVSEGEITADRLRDAVRRVLRLKEKARLFEDEAEVLKSISEQEDIRVLSDEIGEKSIKIIRNAENILPVHLEEGAKILSIVIAPSGDAVGLPVLTEELEARGFRVSTLINPKHYEVHEKIKEHELVLVNCKLSCHNYPGGSIRIGWEHIMPFWRGYIFEHPKVVFTSFGDPYKLYDYPFLKTYVNAHCYYESVQKGFVKVLLGERKPEAKSPVELKGFFECEV